MIKSCLCLAHRQYVHYFSYIIGNLGWLILFFLAKLMILARAKAKKFSFYYFSIRWLRRPGGSKGTRAVPEPLEIKKSSGYHWKAIDLSFFWGAHLIPFAPLDITRYGPETERLWIWPTLSALHLEYEDYVFSQLYMNNESTGQCCGYYITSQDCAPTIYEK